MEDGVFCWDMGGNQIDHLQTWHNEYDIYLNN